ncbi:Zn(2)-C6 fungal-type domain-containing protein [Mycena indigotica]|uniref:Zn(2)-C6 fungal-type domain-containing protein n=1 Tax=Mycena indigotica TaxID=2126181 RepID=A0A8H6WFV5_9AGAR|nr:Zn(2)-C6 fungal-type domain-containing protein [Mycena indigotica]KAF7316157.1 Zn(2)-C6 fungal-type domain-containing protein [Mycena indigotica]
MLSSQKKPPACDSCKAKRVLCHPQPDGQPCPRCVEKQILCKTTYIPRGRRKKTTSALDPLAQQLPNIPSDPAIELLSNPELVKHLFTCLPNLPQHRHPLFQDLNVGKVLAAASWKLDLLHPQLSALAHCICAVTASVAFHPAIVGSDIDLPSSMSDPKYFYLGADLRVFGSRRSQARKLLQERALRVALDTHVHIEVSPYNALSCFILDSLEEDIEHSSRPWAASYMSHFRTLMVSMPDTQPDRPLWAGYFMAESLRAVMHRKPVLVTHADQLFISQGAPPSLESFLEASQKETSLLSPKSRANLAFDCIHPFLFHATRLCRELYETISGDFARRQPISEPALRNIVETFTTIQGLLSSCFGEMDFPTESMLQQAKELAQTTRPETSTDLRLCAFGMSVIFAGLVLTLHTELERRAAEAEAVVPSSHSSKPAMPQQSRWASERIAFLRSQVHALALSALPDINRVLTLSAFPLRGLAGLWTNIMGWAEFCIQEADCRGGIAGIGTGANARGNATTEETAHIYEHILHSLKGIGYLHVSPRLDSLIERMEAHLVAYRSSQQPSTADDMAMSVFTSNMDSFGSGPREMGPASDTMSFLLDGSWMVNVLRSC